jgi:hypothetical protein
VLGGRLCTFGHYLQDFGHFLLRGTRGRVENISSPTCTNRRPRKLAFTGVLYSSCVADSNALDGGLRHAAARHLEPRKVATRRHRE